MKLLGGAAATPQVERSEDVAALGPGRAIEPCVLTSCRRGVQRRCYTLTLE